MDATRLGLSVVLGLSLLNFGCQPKVLATSANCAGQAVPDSFLVRWNGQVPQEYEKFKVAPNSVVTRFTNMSESDLEKNVLAKHTSEYLVAEHEFKINALQQQVSSQDSSTDGTWGPTDIEASSAWTYLGEEGDGVTVAVIDSGIDVNHPLLASQIAPGGYSWVGNPTDLSDQYVHGTHVSGVIAGQPSGNFTGVAPHAKILPLKFIGIDGAGMVSNAISAIVYAVGKGAKVINASWGGDLCSSTLQQEIVAASQSGTVFVNAAGNSHNDISLAPEYPAVYQAPGKITIAAYAFGGVLSSFSNFGALVDLAAPGQMILSTVPPSNGLPEGQMLMMSGTSMATPFVSGVAALLFAARPSATPEQIVSAIDAGVVPGHFNVKSGGRLDAYLAAQYLMTH